MLKISDFSRVSRVSVRALRYYDALGLLVPLRVDRETGYRYYGMEQLPRLNRILALKDLGFSLAQVAQLLDGDLPTAQMWTMLDRQRRRQEWRVHEEQERLARVEARLRQIEREGTMSAYEVVVRPVDALTVAATREIVPTIARMGERVPAMIAAVGAAIAQAGLRQTGPYLARFHNQSYTERDIDTEIAVGVADGTPSGPLTGGDIAVRTLPASERAASVIHRSSFATINDAYAALGRWLSDNGCRIAAPSREIYLTPPDTDEPVTEIQFPIDWGR